MPKDCYRTNMCVHTSKQNGWVTIMSSNNFHKQGKSTLAFKDLQTENLNVYRQARFKLVTYTTRHSQLYQACCVGTNNATSTRV